MDFRANNPGSVQYGNFINYYQFNSAEERLKLLPENVWHASRDTETPHFVLDIGCNSGVLTLLLHEYLTKQTGQRVMVLGIDLDPMLIERAKELNKNPNEISYLCVDIMSSEGRAEIQKYLTEHKKGAFDSVFVMSVTMWIHLNHGDDGLKHFLKNCVDLSDLLVIEPQPWKCYQTAVKRLRKGNEEFPNFPLLKWRSNVESEIEYYLENTLGQQKIYETAPTKWKRKLCFYRDKYIQ